MKRGPKGQSAEMKKAAGETRPSRKVVTLFADHASRPDPDKIVAPKWMPPAARKIFGEKVERYRQRGQKISGFEDTLAQYCALEAELIDMRRKRIVPPMAMVNGHRIWAAEFYDTPASHKVPASGSGKSSNPFSAHGQRPATA